MADWIQEIDPAIETEKLKTGLDMTSTLEYPSIMSSGWHMDYNANTQM
jgi:hypothetical protein